MENTKLVCSQCGVRYLTVADDACVMCHRCRPKSGREAVTFEVTAKVHMRDLFSEDQVEMLEDFLDALRSGDDGTPYGVVDREEFSKALVDASDEELPPTMQVTLEMMVENCRNNAATVLNFL